MKLRALFLGVMGLVYINFSYGQAFQPTDSLSISNLENPQMLWLDLTNDSSYDLFVWGKSPSSGKTEIRIFSNQGAGMFMEETVDIPDILIHAVQLKDYNRDQIMDIVFSGVLSETDTVISVLNGAADFTFTLSADTLLNEAVESFEMLDLNHDTIEDLIVGLRNDSDSLEYKILKGISDGFEETMGEFPRFQEANRFTFDIDSDGWVDLMLSGTRLDDSTTYVLKNQGNFQFENLQITHTLTETIIEELTVGEFDKNRFPDFFVSGKSKDSDQLNTLHSNNGGAIDSLRAFLPDYEINNSLMVDFDSDGLTDLWIQAEKDDSTFHFWYNDLESLEDSVRIFRDSIINTEFADYNLDGHIDYVELIQRGDSLDFKFYESLQPRINFGPRKPVPQVAVQTGSGELKISWQASTDSLTDTGSLSYDALFLSSDSVKLFEANMREGNYLPAQPAHGNQLYASELVMNDLPSGDYFYLVRSIDNAFNFLGRGGGGGEVELGRVTICEEELVVSNVEMCPGSFEIFGTEGVMRNWYSKELGAIGQSDLITYTAGGSDDVIYGSVMEFTDCSEGQLEIRVDVLGGPSPSLVEPFTQVCGEQTIEFELDRGWSNVLWSSSLLGDFSTEHKISLDISQSDTLFVQATNAEGCKFQARGIISFVDFNPAVEDTTYTIELGESVQLSASGGDRYIWGPGETLSNPFSSSPTASPRETTTYSVIIRSPENCVERLSVTVIVEQPAGSAANLFTPNGDNRNDSFFLQLPGTPAAIDFRIYTREGNLIFRERRPNRVVSIGWDGRHNGKKMPPGVYYWRVEGLYRDGTRVRINSDNSGKVHLIR